MKKQYSLLIVFLLAGSLLHACSFIISPFCITVNEYYPNLTILSGRITAEVDHGVSFEVFDVLRGSETRSSFTIWDDSPLDCNGPFLREAIQLGNIGDSIIVAIPTIDSLQNPWEVLEDYRAPFSYVYTSSLRIENNRVKGLIGGYYGNPGNAIEDMAYSDFITKLIEEKDCTLLVDTSSPFLEESLEVFPNPATDRLFVQTATRHQLLNYQLYSSTGQLVQKGDLRTNQIDLTELSTGLYILAVQSEHGIFRRERIVIL